MVKRKKLNFSGYTFHSVKTKDSISVYLKYFVLSQQDHNEIRLVQNTFLILIMIKNQIEVVANRKEHSQFSIFPLKDIFERFTSQKCILPELSMFDEMVTLTHSEDPSIIFFYLVCYFSAYQSQTLLQDYLILLAISIIQKTAVTWYRTEGAHFINR